MEKDWCKIVRTTEGEQVLAIKYYDEDSEKKPHALDIIVYINGLEVKETISTVSISFRDELFDRVNDTTVDEYYAKCVELVSKEGE